MKNLDTSNLDCPPSREISHAFCVPSPNVLFDATLGFSVNYDRSFWQKTGDCGR